MAKLQENWIVQLGGALLAIGAVNSLMILMTVGW
jgi:hypothetical protein